MLVNGNALRGAKTQERSLIDTHSFTLSVCGIEAGPPIRGGGAKFRRSLYDERQQYALSFYN